jgi:hypothetical protein
MFLHRKFGVVRPTIGKHLAELAQNEKECSESVSASFYSQWVPNWAIAPYRHHFSCTVVARSSDNRLRSSVGSGELPAYLTHKALRALIGNRASFLCTKAPMLRVISVWHRD